MDYDDIVIGSGLSALGTVLGLARDRRVLVLGGPVQELKQYYDPARTVPCGHFGFGGLGNFWHGVIPVGERVRFAETSRTDFATVFDYFYPGTDVVRRLGEPFVFVPWRPIRPAATWRRLAAERPHLEVTHESVESLDVGSGGVSVKTNDRGHSGGRVWVCSGALQTPFLLERSFGASVRRATVSDHVLAYVGQIDRRRTIVAPATVERTRSGMWLQAWYDTHATGLFSLRPARFAFRRLDWGIEHRAVFGLPLGGAVAKITRSASAGLIAEALYNRAGLFPGARIQSVYAQLAVPDAHWLRGEGELPLETRHAAIRAATDKVRAGAPWPGVVASRRPEIFIPVIHLHHSVDLDALRKLGVNAPSGRVQVTDASVLAEIGPEHHSFKLLTAAYAKARTLQ